MIDAITSCPLSLTILLQDLNIWVTRWVPYKKHELFTIHGQMGHPRACLVFFGGCFFFYLFISSFVMWSVLFIFLVFIVGVFFALFVFVLPCLVPNVDCVSGFSIPDRGPSVFSNMYFPNTFTIHQNILNDTQFVTLIRHWYILLMISFVVNQSFVTPVPETKIICW